MNERTRRSLLRSGDLIKTFPEGVDPKYSARYGECEEEEKEREGKGSSSECGIARMEEPGAQHPPTPTPISSILSCLH